MARPIEFDREKAVETAMNLFWQQGYTATSLNRLLAAMGIGRSSFYAAFGDKRSLYIECLDLFYEGTRRILDDAWERHRSPRAIVDFFEHTLLSAPGYQAKRGCMMVNTVLELAGVDEDLNQLAANLLSRIESLFVSYFREAHRCGQIPADQDPEKLAKTLMVVNQGLRVASCKGLSRGELRNTLNAVLTTVGLTPA